MKKAFCFCMVLLLACTVLLPATQVSAAAATRTPVINVEGEKSIGVWSEDGTCYYPTKEMADELVNEAIRALTPLFVKAYITDNYDEWSRRALEKLTPIYDEIRPAPDGSLPENTGPDLSDVYTPDPDALPAPESVDWYYGYGWDFRISPLDAADDLHAFIQAVKEKTGAEKVVLSSRCGSTSLGAAYLYKYGTKDLEKVIFSASTLLGTPYADAAISGNISIPGDALYYFMREYDLLGGTNDLIARFVYAMVNALNMNGSADDTAKLLLRIYDKIKDCFASPFLRSYYGICGNYITSVDEHYEDYRDYIFPTDELKQEYAAILTKADEYHYNVQEKLNDLIADTRAAGVPVYIIAFYGEPNGYPINERSRLVGDDLCDAQLQSLGARVAVFPGTLSDDYIAAQEQAGLGGYISPDRQIDASACMLPETTWFIKNIRHEFFYSDFHDFIRRIAWTDNFTVASDPNYPQFLTVVGDHESLAPAQAVNERDIDLSAYEADMSGTTGLLARITAFFAKIIAFFARLFRLIK